MIITCYVTGVQLKPEQQREIVRYLLHMQRPDGGWGMYVLVEWVWSECEELTTMTTTTDT